MQSLDKMWKSSISFGILIPHKFHELHKEFQKKILIFIYQINIWTLNFLNFKFIELQIYNFKM